MMSRALTRSTVQAGSDPAQDVHARFPLRLGLRRRIARSRRSIDALRRARAATRSSRRAVRDQNNRAVCALFRALFHGEMFAVCAAPRLPHHCPLDRRDLTLVQHRRDAHRHRTARKAFWKASATFKTSCRQLSRYRGSSRGGCRPRGRMSSEIK